MARSLNDVLRQTSQDYLAGIDPANPPPPAIIEEQLLDATQFNINLQNQARARGNTWKIPQKLLPYQIALIIATLYAVYTICTGGPGSDPAYDLLAIYQSSGPNEGIYVTDENVFRRLMLQYNFSLTRREFEEAMDLLRCTVKRRYRCTDQNLIAVNNGIFDYKNKTLLPFDPEYIFLSKCRVNYNPNATSPTIHNPNDGTDWEIEAWMCELSDDPEIIELMWQILGAIIRPFVPWNKSAWFYSDTGNNGKGTLCELMRQLAGAGSYASIPLSDMAKDFMLEPLTHVTCIIVDENDVGTYIDKAANLKAIITGDVIQINRKFKSPVAYQFYGFMVQCLNEPPKLKDKSDSIFRRQLFVPFTKCFTGRERKYIKHEYLHRQDVLEYVLYRVLNMNYYELSEPRACALAKAEYRELNDPIRQFLADVLPVARWSLLPFTLLYDMYYNWSKRYNPSGKIKGKVEFNNNLLDALKDYPDWECLGKDKQLASSGRMSCPEPLLEEYFLNNWENKVRLGKLSKTYRGIIRKTGTGTASSPD